MILTAIPSRRGLLIGLTCGVLLGLGLNLFVPESQLDGLAARLWGVFGCGAVGALLGGFVRMTGWLTSFGAVIGLMVLGMLCDRAIRDPQSVRYGIFLGAALGGYFGYALGTRLEWAMAQLKDDPIPSSGAWDREFDG